MEKPHRIVILGAGGHAKVLRSALLERPLLYLGNIEVTMQAHNRPVRTKDRLAFGFVDWPKRRELIKKYGKQRFMEVRHFHAIVSEFATIGHAPQIMAGAIIQPNVTLGDFVVVNTGAQIDHDSVVEDFAVIAPGAVLVGDVRVQCGAFVGANATVLGGRTIGGNAIVGAGAVVTKDVPPNAIVVGNPARLLRMAGGGRDGDAK